MPSEKVIIKYCIAAIILGLSGIYAAVIFIEPEHVSLSNIDDSQIGKVLETEGVIDSAKVSNTTTLFATIAENGLEMQIIKFNYKEDLPQKGDLVIVTGDVSKYEGKLEILARTLTVKGKP
jgi:hypothetical protein